MFPPKITGGSSASPTLNPYTLFFHNTQTANDVIRTRAVFRFDDPSTLKALQNCKNVDLRIERYGDLTSTMSTRPLHSFTLDTSGSREMQFDLPEKLDLDISDSGILGRQVTLLSQNSMLGTGIVGYN
ncbi:hypothetical protein DTO164E3_6521 [Paecilomyces variotii]|nr:hypothetical protein DTO164E3_6521 [Paecilomyces variotii]KAJ9197440.1 hypothetical protein DTO032I3_5922 [Paecilomyces variotii]KAJ9248823.1 hypothetical protein DTO207G8_7155 [Paecilomyces variotii]KAJ9260263.1 hypothetical protein DTO195F2_4553 [Paecilomyces variotii]KAJ9275165.1 hypothetical protein DTO021D3_7923 [Paecilomyces variotii]